MKKIQWFPGHMTKAMRMMEASVPLADGIIYVLDARCPAASFNRKLLKMAGGKPVLYVLNKADLADERVDNLMKLLGGNAVKINAANAGSKRIISSAIDKLVAEKREKSLAKGLTKVFRFMVVGVPNTGKSTVINLLAGSKRTVTGDKAGVTRGKQWIRLDGFELLDTPGTMPPAFDNQRLALHLAFVGSINDDILDLDDVALELLGELYEKYPARLEERYGITGGEKLEMLDCVCARRGFVLRGGEYDYERAERAVIDDFRKGRLGRITLDTVEDIKESFKL
ncbi:MAG TPA: ribosome biogenesis GTPase YlqF [Clostridiales bacterium]|nr:ribosome biogenesis GTPase YlqF [Clostridiales bacterium]